MDLCAELKALRKQLYTYRYKSLELERQLRTHCHTFHQSIDERRGQRLGYPNGPPVNAFEDTLECYVSVFTNSLLMEIISNHLPVQDLLKCRLVCKLWAREMAQYLTKRKALVVAYEDCQEARDICKKKEAGKFVNISTLCILEIPITCPLITDVVRNFGETLSGLKLDDCNPNPEDLHNLLVSIPSLEVLSFKQTGMKPRRRRNRRREDETLEASLSKLDMLTEFSQDLVIPTVKKLSWEETKAVHKFERIVQMFPNVEELELLCWAKPSPEKLKGLKMDNLRVLTFSCDNNFSEQHFLALASLKLKVKKLTLHDLKPGGRKKMRAFKIFLASVAETVVEMNLNANGRILQAVRNAGGGTIARFLQTSTRQFTQESSPFPIEFPNLQKLEIDCSLLTDLRTVDAMPKLQKLECKFQDWKGWWHLLNKNGVPAARHGALRDLTLGSIDSGCLRKMAPFFGTVTRLDVSEDRIDDVAFRTICENMKQLSHLRITQSTNDASKKLQMTDAGITGISSEGLEVLKKQLPAKETTEKVFAMRKFAYIGDLRALYSLELALSQIEMTDLGILYGIADLKRVTTITLPKCDLSDASLQALGEMKSLSDLEMHQHSGVSKDAVAALKLKRKDLAFNLYSDLTARMFS